MPLMLDCPSCGATATVGRHLGSEWKCQECERQFSFQRGPLREVWEKLATVKHVVCDRCSSSDIEPSNAQWEEYDWYCRRCRRWFTVATADVLSVGVVELDLL